MANPQGITWDDEIQQNTQPANNNAQGIVWDDQKQQPTQNGVVK